jgi:hypothetical protein
VVGQGQSWALTSCDTTDNQYCIPFQGKYDGAEGPTVVLTVGYLLLAALVLPQGNMNLDENIQFQIVSFIMLVVLTGVFLVNYWVIGFDYSTTPAFGDPVHYPEGLGTVIFNFAFVIFIPSWLNEKQPHVSVNKSIWHSTVGSTFMYLGMGLFGAWAASPQPPMAPTIYYYTTGYYN